MIAWRVPVQPPLHDNAWVRPAGNLDYRVTSPYGMRPDPLRPGKTTGHGALDIGNTRLGGAIRAAAAGKVIAAGFVGAPWTVAKPSDATWASWGGLYDRRPSLWEGPTWAGRTVVIDHGGGYGSMYCHMATLAVQVGQVVPIGTVLGTIGSSGSAYRSGHLHFGILTGLGAGGSWSGGTVDPWPLITGGMEVLVVVDRFAAPRGWQIPTAGTYRAYDPANPAAPPKLGTFQAGSRALAAGITSTVSPRPATWPVGPMLLVSNGAFAGRLIDASTVQLDAEPPAPPPDCAAAIAARDAAWRAALGEVQP